MVPIELFGDEIDVGLQANSILQTGKDYSGNSFPVMFKSFTEFRLPLLIYSTVPSVAVFGLNEWGVRLPSIFFGMLSLLGIFLLTRKLLNTRTALLAMFFLAISPWHLHFTRQANDAGTILPLIIFGTWVFMLGLERYRMLIISAVLFALTIYSYSIATLFTPIFFLSLLIIFKSKIKRYGLRKLFFCGAIILVVLIPYLNLLVKGEASQRFSTIALFSNQSITDEIILRRVDEDRKFSLIFHNKPTSFFYEWSGNYLRSISPEFLFFKGDPNLRHSVGNRGELYLFQFPLVILGLISVLLRNNGVYLIFLWLLIAPLPSTITYEGGYHAGRLIILLPPLLIFAAMGLDRLMNSWKKIKYKLIIILLISLSVLDISFYLHRYYIEWSKDSFKFWQYGYKQAVSYLKENDEKYSRVFFNNTYEPALPRFLFYYGYSPELFRKHSVVLKNKKNIVPGFDGFKLGDKYYFGIVNKLIKDEGFAELLGPGDVYLVSVKDEVGTDDWISNPPPNLNIIKRIYDPFQKPIFFIVTKKTAIL